MSGALLSQPIQPVDVSLAHGEDSVADDDDATALLSESERLVPPDACELIARQQATRLSARVSA